MSHTVLTQWGQVTHIRISDLNIIGSDNDLAPNWCQAIILTNAGSFSIEPLRTNFSEILIKDTNLSIHKNASENIICETAAIFSMGR